MRKVLFLTLLFLLGGYSIQAQERTGTEVSNEVEVEVLFHSFDDRELREYVGEIVLDDGTRIGDLNYRIVQSNSRVDNRMSLIDDYFYFAAWITRDDELSLSLDPTNDVRINRSTKNKAWDVLVDPNIGFGSHENWRNTQVMNWQFTCHFDFAPRKDRWNIEPHRIANSYLAVVLASCNP